MQGVEECRNRRRRRRRARRVVVVVMCSRARVRVCVFARVCMRALRVLEVLEVETADEEKQRRLKQAGPPSPPPLPLPVLCLPPPSPLPPLPPHVCRWRLRAPGSLYAEATPAAKRAGKKKQPPPHSRLSLPSPPLLVSPSLGGASCKLLIYRLGGGEMHKWCAASSATPFAAMLEEVRSSFPILKPLQSFENPLKPLNP